MGADGDGEGGVEEGRGLELSGREGSEGGEAGGDAVSATRDEI